MADLNGEIKTRDSAVNMKPPSSIISTTKIAAEQAVESTSAGNGSSLVFEGDSKCHEAERHSPDEPASTWSRSPKSEISQDDSQHRTESSCSNSFKSYGGSSVDQHGGAIGGILVHSSNSENLNCSSEKEENVRSCNEHLASHSAERTICSEISGESENICKLGPEIMDNAKSETLKEQNAFVAGFDLNEDINGDDHIIQPFAQSSSCHSVFRVVAKVAVSRGLPMKPLKFEGRLGWIGSVETSAFRSTILNCSRKSPQSFMGFDLNVAAGEDCASNEFQDSSSREVGPSKTEGLGFDLNCLYAAADEFPTPSHHESRYPHLMDLNLNSGSEISVKREAYFMAGPNSLQQLEFMQRVSPFQQKLQCTSHALPPRSYMSKAPFHFTATDPLPSTIHYSRAMSPHSEHPKENGVFMNLRMAHSFGPPYFMQVAHGHSNSLAVSMPKVEEHLSRSVSKMDEARRLFFLANNSQTEEQVKSLQQQAWSATSAKRKEPEGGFEYYQLGHRC